MTFKEKAHKIIESLPEEPTSEQVENALYELLDRSKIEEGIRASEAGDTLSHEEVEQRMARWLSK